MYPDALCRRVMSSPAKRVCVIVCYVRWRRTSLCAHMNMKKEHALWACGLHRCCMLPTYHVSAHTEEQRALVLGHIASLYVRCRRICLRVNMGPPGVYCRPHRGFGHPQTSESLHYPILLKRFETCDSMLLLEQTWTNMIKNAMKRTVRLA
jgi:hypothetical protein